MELLVERTFAIFIAISGPILTIFDLPGNTLLLLTSLMFAFFDEVLYFNGRLLSAMVLIYASAFSALSAVRFPGSRLFSLPWEALPALCSVH